MHLTTVNECPNCATSLDEQFRFCPTCGQNTHLHRFNLPHIFHEIFHAFTHADKGVLYLIKGLAIRPGVVAREYVLEGKRKKYFNPFTFLLLILGFVVFVNSFFQPYGKEQTPKKPDTTISSSSKDKAIYERSAKVTTFLNKRANLVAFVALPIFTLVFWLFFLRTGINYAEHLVANVFFAGFFQLVAGFVTIILGLFNKYISTISEQQLVFQLFYLPFAYYQFINYQRPVKFLITLLASLLALGAWILISTQVIYFYIRYGL